MGCKRDVKVGSRSGSAKLHIQFLVFLVLEREPLARELAADAAVAVRRPPVLVVVRDAPAEDA